MLDLAIALVLEADSLLSSWVRERLDWRVSGAGASFLDEDIVTTMDLE